MALLQRAWHICLLREGPQDLPYSPQMTLQTLLLLGAVLWVGIALVPGQDGAAPGWAYALVGVATTAAWPWVALRLRRWGERYAQAVFAFALTGLLFAAVALPLQIIAGTLLPGGGPINPDAALPVPLAFIGLVMLLLLVWKLRVDAHLWAQTLDIPRFPALMIALALAISEVLLINAFAPVAATP